MKFSQLISGVMVKLAVIPGLGFLQGYVMAAKGMKTRFGQRVGDYEAYAAGATSAYQDVRGGEGSEEGVETGAEEEDWESESDQVVDYYDLYQDSDPLPQRGERYDQDDDYPSSDDYKSYHDDEY